MFGKLKQFVGMVGIEVQLEIDQQFPMGTDTVQGMIHIYAKQEQTITKVKVSIRQAIMEGSGQDRRRRDYWIGEVMVDQTPFTIKTGETKDYEFTLPFQPRKTMSQSMSEQGGVIGALGAVGKFMDNERDEFWVNAVADVKGAALDPNATRQIWFN